MPRKRSSLVEDIIVSLMKLPWWASIICAAGFWFLGQVFLARLDPAEMLSPFFEILYKVVFNGLAILCVVIAPLSAIKSFSRRKLLDRQKSIDSIRLLSWREFEQLVGEAFRRQGYDIEETGGSGPDGGIDLILRGHGETVLVQCKRWKARQVGVDKVRELFGVVTAESADRGILVTSGIFTKEALTFQTGKPLSLIDGPALEQMVEGVQPAGQAPEPASDIRSQFPSVASAKPTGDPVCHLCGSSMLLRTARRGKNAGSQFFGCSRYPACKGTRPFELEIMKKAE